jgi:hypothetical protein
VNNAYLELAHTDLYVEVIGTADSTLVAPVFVAAAWVSSRVERKDQNWAVGNLDCQNHPGVALEKI